MKVVCFMPNYIGDILMVTPAIRFLKENLPEVQVSCVVREQYRELLDDNPNIDMIIPRSPGQSVGRQVSVVKPEVTILFRTTIGNAFASFSAHPKYSVGFRQELAQIFLKKAVDSAPSMPYREECLGLVRTMLMGYLEKERFVEVDLRKPEIFGYDTPEIAGFVRRKLAEFHVDGSASMVLINPVASRKTKMVSFEQYVQIVSMLKRNLGDAYEIVLVGGPNEREFVNQLMIASRVKSVAGVFSLKQLAYLISKSAVFVSPDTGPALIAQAVGTRSVIYFASTSPEKYGPYNALARAVYTKVQCSPCSRDECTQKDRLHCLKKVNLDEIVGTTLDLAEHATRLGSVPEAVIQEVTARTLALVDPEE
jgi:ADP-heptose:LPS heptosyltransferase